MLNLSPKFRALWLLAICLLAALMFFLIVSWPQNALMIHFFDVGQGDSVLLQTPRGNQILVDGGAGRGVIEELGKVMPYFDKSLDLVVLTHPHNDHVEGLVDVFRRFEVENVLITGVEDDLGSYKEILQEVLARETRVHFARADKDFYFGSVLFDVIYPFEPLVGEHFENANNSSIVLLVSYKGRKLLLTGDAEMEIEKELLDAKVDLNADILKVPHHGSKTSSTFSFLEAVNPQYAIFSLGADNSYGHPHDEVLGRYRRRNVEILRTDELGTISLKIR